MSITDSVERMRATLDGLVREQADRRAMRDRQSEERKAEAQDHMTKQVQASQKAIEYRRELVRREKEAGGWATEKTLTEKNTVMGFNVDEEEEAGPGFTGHALPPAVTGSGVEVAKPTTWEPPPAPTPSAPPPPAPEPVAEAAPPPRRPRHARREQSFDDDDFSNNSWMK